MHGHYFNEAYHNYSLPRPRDVDDVFEVTSSIVKIGHLLLFGHVAHVDGKADVNQTTFPKMYFSGESLLIDSLQ